MATIESPKYCNWNKDYHENKIFFLGTVFLWLLFKMSTLSEKKKSSSSLKCIQTHFSGWWGQDYFLPLFDEKKKTKQNKLSGVSCYYYNALSWIGKGLTLLW